MTLFFESEKNKHPTNVFKLFKAIPHEDKNGIQQIALYDAGIGSGADIGDENWWDKSVRFVDRLAGGGFGRLCFSPDLSPSLAFLLAHAVVCFPWPYRTQSKYVLADPERSTNICVWIYVYTCLTLSHSYSSIVLSEFF